MLFGFKNKKKYYLNSTDINIPNEIITENFGTVHRPYFLFSDSSFQRINTL